ncbi:aminotransferase class IV [Nocardioides albus]|uniref:Branched-chain amino acid aminotransferase n=1 Tax=Nocardioides albus TaxID=1841 RepID=A0A7W5A7P0_9ACTN|nr:aminotransferase class IV [Nocardioides albus]MBB3091131.1 branched-chain amino acid aminotransferase [Nocardioides albus]GGU34127.1 4-amino-4-deoxychorismate lyase [Nocardioides albus]
MRAWIDGHLLDNPTAPAVSVRDHGLVVGDGVFETLKVIEDRPFALSLHLDRLERSANGLGLPTPDRTLVTKGVEAVLGAGPTAYGRLRITVTGGPAPFGSGRAEVEPTIMVGLEDATPLPAETKVVSVPWRRNEHAATTGLKTTSYAENVIALAEAHKHGASEAIFANTVGDLCEGTGSNVFYVLDGELKTPTISSGPLAGITRALVLKWFGAQETDEPLAEVEEYATEVFLTSSLRDVQAVTEWGTRTLPHGPVTRAAQEAWRTNEQGLLGL